MSLTPCTAFIPGHLPLQPARHSCTSHTWPKTAAVAVLIAPRTRSVRGWKQRAFLRSGVVSQAPELLEAESEEERLQRMLLDLGEFELLEGSSSELLQRAFTSLRNTKGGKEAKERLPSSSELLGLFASAVLQDPSNVEAIFGMGVFLEVSHRPMEMLRWMDLVLELQPKHLGAWEALAGYRQLASLDTARTRPRDALLEHQQVYVLPMEVWSEGVAEDLQVAAKHVDREWQENAYDPPRDIASDRSFSVMAWDDVLCEELLRHLEESVKDHFEYIFTNRHVFGADEDHQGPAANMWLPSQRAPSNAAEVAARSILRHLLKEEITEFAGVEYWARVRSFNLGARFHYDADVDAEEREWVQGNPWRPWTSCVFYLTTGGPTVVLEQVLSPEGHLTPSLPACGHLCVPKRNRLLVMRGDLFHGSLPVKVWLDSDESRKVFIFNFWRRHRPTAPSCQEPCLARHVAMQPHLLQDSEVQNLEKLMELHYQDLRETPLRPQILARPEDLPHSSDFGYLPVLLPMPSMEQVCAEGGFYRLDWLRAAEKFGPQPQRWMVFFAGRSGN
ncbi:unnamed protein product [Durusdinium trenchii]|uniref:Prolyl 4-hydroxylase alpha subunit domain-containing protein n=1 Tax=Durusdinium trenchii TaxID=1381693 RepID=A0ABP0HTW1_9DINO